MRRDEDEARRLVTIGERQAGFRCAAERRGDAGHHDSDNVRLTKSVELLATTAKNERVAAFQAHDSAATARRLDEATVDLILPDARLSLALADKHALCIAARAVKHGLTHQIVIEHDVGALQGPQGTERQKIRIARSGTHDIDDALLRAFLR